MHLGADMVRDQAHDALAIGGRQRSPVSASPSESRSTQSRPSGFSITSTTAGLRENGRWPAERGAQHARAARERFRLLAGCGHSAPLPDGAEKTVPGSG
jgi:hypothetical protein